MMNSESVQTKLFKIFEEYKRPVVWVSGGKDSLTLLHMLRPWRHKVCVIHCYEPDGWPGTTENLNRCLDAWGFLRNVHLEPAIPFEDYTNQYGWPVEIVPSKNDGSITPISPYYDGDIKLVSWWHCTIVRQLQVLDWCTTSMHADVVLTGSRGEDGPWFAQQGAMQHETQRPWVRYNPLQSWSSNDVYAYVDEHSIPLPEYYQWKRHSSFEWVDCMSCTWQLEHWKILKDHYPDEYAKRWPQAKQVFDTLKQSLSDQLSMLEY